MSDENIETRPEWVKCVADVPDQEPPALPLPARPWRSFCGRDLWGHEWVFRGIKRAQRTVEFGSRLVACAGCASAAEVAKK